MLLVTLRLIRKRWSNRWPGAVFLAATVGAGVLIKLLTGLRKASYIHPPEPWTTALPEALMWAAMVFVVIMIWPGRLRTFDDRS